MPWSLLEIPLALPVFCLVLFRLTGLMLVAPIFSSRIIPGRMRALLILALGALMFPVVRPDAPENLTLGMAVVGGFGELMIGASIGLTLTILIVGVEVAGLMIGMQAGMAMGRIFDPTLGREVNLFGQAFNTVLMLLFLCLGGHRALLAALLDTYAALPLLTFQVDETLLVLLTEVLTAAFVLAIRLAAPALIALFLTTTAMGFLSRTMPQMNILTVGFTVKAMVALGATGITLGAAGDLLVNSAWDVLDLARLTFELGA